MKNTVLLIVFTLFVVICFLLFSGNDFIFLTLPGNIPLGNVIAALCFILPSFGVQYFMNDIARYKTLRKISLITSCIWLPMSMVLSGNLQLAFEGYSFGIWVFFSFVASALIIFTLIHSIVYCIKNLSERCLNKA
jgi:hypothetical protein